MLNYEIILSYTEKLNIFNYLENITEDQNITMSIAFRGFVDENDKLENSIIFKVYYDVESSKYPIVLNWVGVFILQFDEKPNVTVDDLFKDEKLQEQLNNFIEILAKNLVGKLPSFSEMIGGN